MTIKDRMKIIQCGVGGFGKGWLAIVKKSMEWELAGIVDISGETLDSAALEHGITEDKCFLSVDDAIESGLDVLVEKPLSDRMEDAIEMVEAANKHNKKIMVSQNYRYRSQPRTVRNFIEEGELAK